MAKKNRCYRAKKTDMKNWLKVGKKEITIYQAQRYGIKPFDCVKKPVYKKLRDSR